MNWFVLIRTVTEEILSFVLSQMFLIIVFLSWNGVFVGYIVFESFIVASPTKEELKVVWQSLNSASSKLRLRGSDQHAPQVRKLRAVRNWKMPWKEDKGLSRVDFLYRSRFRPKDAGNPLKLPREAATDLARAQVTTSWTVDENEDEINRDQPKSLSFPINSARSKSAEAHPEFAVQNSSGFSPKGSFTHRLNLKITS